MVVAECKSSATKAARNLQKDIMEFAALQKSIVRSVNATYGRDAKLKFIWLLVTRNIILSDPDLKRAAHENIQVIGDRDLRYYEEIAKNIGRAAKYQFLAEFLEGTKATYQRLVKRARLNQIGSFLDGGGFFPNSILVNFKKRVRFDIRQSYEDRQIHFGDLYLPDAYKTAWIIDGQHRLYGFTEITGKKKPNVIAVVAFENISREIEADLFATINGKQAKVSKNILDELEGDLKFDSEDFKSRIGAIASRALSLLDAENGGPFNDRMKTPETEESDTVCLTISELKKSIIQSGLIGRPGSSSCATMIWAPASTAACAL